TSWGRNRCLAARGERGSARLSRLNNSCTPVPSLPHFAHIRYCSCPPSAYNMLSVHRHGSPPDTSPPAGVPGGEPVNTATPPSVGGQPGEIPAFRAGRAWGPDRGSGYTGCIRTDGRTWRSAFLPPKAVI